MGRSQRDRETYAVVGNGHQSMNTNHSKQSFGFSNKNLRLESSVRRYCFCSSSFCSNPSNYLHTIALLPCAIHTHPPTCHLHSAPSFAVVCAHLDRSAGRGVRCALAAAASKSAAATETKANGTSDAGIAARSWGVAFIWSMQWSSFLYMSCFAVSRCYSLLSDVACFIVSLCHFFFSSHPRVQMYPASLPR